MTQIFIKTALTGVLLTFVPSAVAGESEPAPTAGRAQYEVRQALSYELGSKFTSGYFVRQAGKCLVTLMLSERSDPEQPSPITAARIRLILNPSQIMGLDSEEGHSLNFTCGANATALLVDAGERNKLIALQQRTQMEALADRKGD